MSYTINITGHLEGDDVAERTAEIKAAAEDFVESLDGVISGYFSSAEISGTLVAPKEVSQ